MSMIPRTQSSGLRVIEATEAPMQAAGVVGTILPHASMRASSQSAAVQVNNWDAPKSVTITVTSTFSAAPAASAPVNVYLFNRPLGEDVTDNGGGANSITYQYQDGKGGLRLDALINRVRAGMGIPCYGVAIRMITLGAADPTGLGQTNPFFTYYNAFNRTKNYDLNATDGQGRKDQDLSIQVWSIEDGYNIAAWTQFGFLMPSPVSAGVSAATCTFYFDRSFLNTI